MSGLPAPGAHQEDDGAAAVILAQLLHEERRRSRVVHEACESIGQAIVAGVLLSDAALLPQSDPRAALMLMADALRIALAELRSLDQAFPQGR